MHFGSKLLHSGTPENTNFVCRSQSPLGELRAAEGKVPAPFGRSNLISGSDMQETGQMVTVYPLVTVGN